MANYFPFTGVPGLFSSGPYYGENAFKGALNYYLGQLQQGAYGQGQSQLAAAQASDPAAEAARSVPSAPAGTGAAATSGQAAKGAELAGEEGGNAAGQQQQAQTQQGATSGGLQVATDYGNSITGAIQGQLAETNAQNQQSQQAIGGITNTLGTVGGLVGLAGNAGLFGGYPGVGGGMPPTTPTFGVAPGDMTPFMQPGGWAPGMGNQAWQNFGGYNPMG